MDENEKVNVRVTFERCPHITVIAGFIGDKPLMHLLIFPREGVPHKFASMLEHEHIVGVSGTES